MPKHLILVAGNIGSGKTSLTERIGQRLGWHTAYESVADNPYLPNFYKDMKSWSFHLQVYFLGHRARQHLQMAQDPRSTIIDRSIYEDAYIFCRALNHLGNLNELDYQTYLNVFNLLIPTLPVPSMLVYLRCPVDVLMARIHKRARDIESSISADYLALLESYYDEWMLTFDACPVLTIKTDDLDFVHKKGHMDIVIKRISEKLSGKEEVVFN
jgi:deoxyadenosine/deoxycytidine kinase